jgi:hypothetical protein
MTYYAPANLNGAWQVVTSSAGNRNVFLRLALVIGVIAQSKACGKRWHGPIGVKFGEHRSVLGVSNFVDVDGGLQIGRRRSTSFLVDAGRVAEQLKHWLTTELVYESYFRKQGHALQ